MLTKTIAECPSIQELDAVVSRLQPVGGLWGHDVCVISTDTFETIPISRISDAFFKLIASQQNRTHEEQVDQQKTWDKIQNLNEDAVFEQNLQLYLFDSSAKGNKHEAVERIRQAVYAQATALVLNCLALNKLPDALWQLTQLQHLDLSGNQLTRLPDALGLLTQLQHLDLSGNQLTRLPDALWQLAQLQHLDLSGNRLTGLPDALGLLTQLEYLYLSWNKLTELPDALWQLVQLQHLYLSWNKLTMLPDALKYLVHLHLIDLRMNDLTELPEALGCLERLQDLYLAGNKLKTLPASLGRLTQLKNLFLARNRLTVLPNTLGQLLQLEHLNLSWNPNLRELPFALGSLPGLTCIDMECTDLNPQLVVDILQQCAAVRRAQGLVILPHRLQTWKTAGNSPVDLSDVERFTDEDKGTLNEWLVRLERTCDFKGHQESLAKAVCEMLSSMTQDEALKMLFLAHMTANIRHCEDRASQSFNELYTSWKVQEFSKDAPLQERVSIMVRGAKTLALRDAIATRIKSWEQANKQDEKEAVEIYLFYEIALKEPLDLLSIIQTMRFADIGQRDWIDKDALIATVYENYVGHLIGIPSFAKICAEDKEFIEMWNPQKDQFIDAVEMLSNSPQAQSSEFSEEGIQYRSKMDAVMQAHKQSHKETVVRWLNYKGIY